MNPGCFDERRYLLLLGARLIASAVGRALFLFQRADFGAAVGSGGVLIGALSGKWEIDECDERSLMDQALLDERLAISSFWARLIASALGSGPLPFQGGEAIGRALCGPELA